MTIFWPLGNTDNTLISLIIIWWNMKFQLEIKLLKSTSADLNMIIESWKYTLLFLARSNF